MTELRILAPLFASIPMGAKSDLTRRFAAVQRLPGAGQPPLLGQSSARVTARQELRDRTERLESAARKLLASAPQAELVSSLSERDIGTELVTGTRTATTTTEVTDPAEPARQLSTIFASSTDIIADHKSKLHLVLASDPKIQIQVGKSGASLQDLADLINNDANNRGRVVASVISSGGGFRLQVETTDTGSAATLSVTMDDFKAPGGGSFQLIDPALAQDPGQDETTETITTTELIAITRRVTTTEEIEEKTLVEDAEFEAIVEEFTDAFNALRQHLGREAPRPGQGDQAGLLSQDARARELAEAVEELALGLESRESERGVTLADLGIQLESDGELRLDADRLQAATASDATGAIQLLTSVKGGLAQDLLDGLASQPRDRSSRQLSVFLERLVGSQAAVESRFRLVEELFQIERG